jgi:hypothetical protein
VHRTIRSTVLVLLLLPTHAWAQGRQTKVQYDSAFRLGSQEFVQGTSDYFQVLTTPAPGDPDHELIRYWAPRLDEYYENVCRNLQLSRHEVCRYLLYPEFFVQIEKLTLEGKLHEDWFEPLLDAVLAVHEGRVPHFPQAICFDTPSANPQQTDVLALPRTEDRQRWDERFVQVDPQRILVWLPDHDDMLRQRCVLYRTLSDFLATPIGPPLPEGVQGFVPRHDPSLPVVIYASLGEDKLQRTAQHEVAHAVVESVAKYNRKLAVTRNRYAKRDSSQSRTWRPGSGGFSAITHENFAEYLAFPFGKMDPTLKASLVERVAENELDGLGALSVGARTIASSYIEGPVRLYFLAEEFGRDMPKRLMVGYFSNTRGFLDLLEEYTGYRLETLEQLYRRWLRQMLWEEHLATDIPDTVGSVLAVALSGVRRDGRTVVQRAHYGRQEIVSMTERPGAPPKVHTLAREISGIERLPLFSSPDARGNRTVAAVRNRNVESLMLWDGEDGRLRELHEINDVREIRDPRLSPSGDRIVFRVVDSAGRNALGILDVQRDEARRVTDWMWEEIAHPSFAECESRILFHCTRTPDHAADVFLLDLDSMRMRNLTNTPVVNETEPVQVRGHLVYLSDASGVPQPVVLDDTPRTLLHMPFPVSGLTVGDSTLILVGNSLRHASAPASRALWTFPVGRLGLAESVSPPHLEPEPQIAMGNVSDTQDRDVSDRPLWKSDIMPARGLDSDVPDNEARFGFSPYKQKWRFMPLGINFSGSSNFATASSIMGFDTEFHDQAFVVGAGRSGHFDRFGMMQYRNSASRTHWQLSGFYRSVVRSRYQLESVVPIDRNEIEAGGMFSAQYHKSLVTRLGFHLAVTRRSDTVGDILTQPTDLAMQSEQAPILGLQLGGLSPQAWKMSLAGLQDLSLLANDSSIGLAQWKDAERRLSADVEPRFAASSEYTRSNIAIGTSWSRDTRVWSDYRGPRAGALFVLSLTAGFNTPGSNVLLDHSESDSLRTQVSSGIDRVTASWLFVTHRRLAFLDLAWRVQGLMNTGHQSLTYGLGGIHSLSGVEPGSIRSDRIAWTNAEVRVPLWDYGRFSVRIPQLVFPAADGFLFYDAGIADGISGLHSYGVGLRLKMGFLTYEWRHQLRSGLQNQGGLTLAW